MSTIDQTPKTSSRATLAKKFALPVVLLGALVAAVVWASNQHGNLDDQKTVDSASADAVATTLDVIPTLLSYDPGTLQEDVAAAQKELTDRFKPQFTQLQKELIEPTVGKDKVLTTAKVQRVAVSKATDDTVDLVVFLEQQTSKAGSEAAPINTRAIVTLKLTDGRWLVDDLKPV